MAQERTLLPIVPAPSGVFRSDSGMVFVDTKPDLKANSSTMFIVKHNDTTLMRIDRDITTPYTGVTGGRTRWIFPMNRTAEGSVMQIGNITITPETGYGASIGTVSGHFGVVASANVSISGGIATVLATPAHGAIELRNSANAYYHFYGVRKSSAINQIADGKTGLRISGNVELTDSSLLISNGGLNIPTGTATVKTLVVDSARMRVVVIDTTGWVPGPDSTRWRVREIHLPTGDGNKMGYIVVELIPTPQKFAKAISYIRFDSDSANAVTSAGMAEYELAMDDINNPSYQKGIFTDNLAGPVQLAALNNASMNVSIARIPTSSRYRFAVKFIRVGGAGYTSQNNLTIKIWFRITDGSTSAWYFKPVPFGS